MIRGSGVRRIGFISSCSFVIAACVAIGCGHADSGSSSTTTAPPPPPTERWTQITSDAAPLLITMKDEFPPPEVLRRGELLRVGKNRGISSWRGVVDDVEIVRDSMVFEAQRSKEGAVSYAFQSDLGGEVTVTATAWLCAELAKDPKMNVASCAGSLRRARAASGAIVSYLPCGTGLCPVVLEREGKIGVIGIQGISSADLVSGQKKSALIVQSREVKDDGKITSGAVEVLSLDGDKPTSAGKFEGDRTDARDPAHVVSKVVKVTVSRGGVSIKGAIEEHGADGAVVKKTPVDELHGIPPLD